MLRGILLAAGLAVSLFHGTAHAVPLSGALTARPGLTADQLSANADARSFDPSGFKNPIQYFLPFVEQTVYKVETFTGHALGSLTTFFFGAEVTYYDGVQNPALANIFGYIDGTNAFRTIFGGSSTVGASAALTQGAAESFTLAFQTPTGTFTGENTNPIMMNALRVAQAGSILIPNATLGGANFLFNLQVGDVILLAEDVPNGDLDYQDFVGVVRQTEVPEPGTMLLLGAAMAPIAARRRRAQA